MSDFLIPSKINVSDKNKKIFEELKEMFGKVPNIFLAFTSSDNGLENYFNYLTKKNSLSYREREVINLVVSQVNECPYCLSLHSSVSERLGFSKEQILDIRTNNIQFDNRLKAVAALAQSLAVSKGSIIGPYLLDFYQEGFDQGHLVDVVLAVGNISTLNLLYTISNVPIDFPSVTVKV